jgi:bacterioferritin-associated ferredoxin
LLAGSGPLLLSAAARLAGAGAQVVAVLECRGAYIFYQSLGHLAAIFAQGGRLEEGWRYLQTLRAKRAPYRLGWVVTRAEGQDGVERAAIARVDRFGRLVPGSEQSVEVDCICLGYGLSPSTQLTRILECEHIFDPLSGAYVPVRDEWMQTSIPGVYAVGDGAQIAGKPAALLEGELAGLWAAVQLGRLAEGRAVELATPLRKKLAEEGRFARLLNQLFGPLPGLYKLVSEDTVICRCENITYGQIREAVADGASSVQAVKYHSRAGMGWCQGNTCAPLVAQIISQERSIPLEAASRASARPPVFPVPIEELMNLEE